MELCMYVLPYIIKGFMQGRALGKKYYKNELFFATLYLRIKDFPIIWSNIWSKHTNINVKCTLWTEINFNFENWLLRVNIGTY